MRERCVFARQNLLSDPPFSRLDLISCRNLLIYIEAGLQQKILPTFHYALKPNGFLLLGASESIGSCGRAVRGGGQEDEDLSPQTRGDSEAAVAGFQQSSGSAKPRRTGGKAPEGQARRGSTRCGKPTG